MVEFLQRVVSVQKFVVLWLWLYNELAGVRASEKVYFDKYGHCSSSEPFDLKDEIYEVFPKGGGFNHENLDCSLSFRAAPGYGVCMTFDDFLIEDCTVELLVYESKTEDGDVWKTLSCQSSRPSQLCTSERYVTLRVFKSMLNGNKGYDFQIEVEQSSSLTDEGVVFASIGFVVGIICGVVLLLILIALAVFCCCRKRGDATTNTKYPMSADQVQPSAPPLMEGEDNSAPAMHLYPHLQLQQETPMLDPPPPYDQPPSYSPHHHT